MALETYKTIPYFLSLPVKQTFDPCWNTLQTNYLITVEF